MEDTLTFRDKVGKKITNDEKYLEFIIKVLKINPKTYDDIYYFNAGVAGAIMFISGDEYFYITLGCGRPIIGRITGTINRSPNGYSFP